jgi:hypothetical protein
VRKANASRSLIAICAASIVAILCWFLLGSQDANQAQANKGVTTESAATAAGANVLPTDPKLRIEPK